LAKKRFSAQSTVRVSISLFTIINHEIPWESHFSSPLITIGRRQAKDGADLETFSMMTKGCSELELEGLLEAPIYSNLQLLDWILWKNMREVTMSEKTMMKYQLIYIYIFMDYRMLI